MRDIFVSYTSSDREWAHWIAAELRAQGHEPHVHEWEIDAGGGRAAITTLRGMWGVGKTVLAAAYADKHRLERRTSGHRNQSQQPCNYATGLGRTRSGAATVEARSGHSRESTGHRTSENEGNPCPPGTLRVTPMRHLALRARPSFASRHRQRDRFVRST